MSAAHWNYEELAPKGIHVIMEKPLAATLKEALEIQALARKHNILVLTNYGSTWQATQYAARAAIDAGAIGPVWRLHGVQGHNGPGDPKTSFFAAWRTLPPLKLVEMWIRLSNSQRNELSMASPPTSRAKPVKTTRRTSALPSPSVSLAYKMCGAAPTKTPPS